MNLKIVFSKPYIFDPIPNPESRFLPVLLAIFAAMLLFGILVFVVNKKERIVLSDFINPTITCGFLGLIHVFGRYESLSFIATRYYLLAVITIFILWSLILLIKLIRKVPVYKKIEKTELRYEKYLPKSKKKR